MQKLYCFVDETGQDTKGKLFIVGGVLVSQPPDAIRQQLERIERESKKGAVKWTKTTQAAQFNYMNMVLSAAAFRRTLFFRELSNTTEYLRYTAETTARAITMSATDDYRVTVLIDGLPNSRRNEFTKALRNYGITIEKVRGVREEETEPLMRLADAICGFVRDARKRTVLAQLFEKAVTGEYLREIKDPHG